MLQEIGSAAKLIVPMLIDLTRWTSSSRDGRCDLLADPTFLPAQRATELHVPELEQVTTDLRASLSFEAAGNPDRPSERTLVALLDWAEDCQAITTAYIISKVVLPICPSSAMLNYRAGRLARRIGEYKEAERLFTDAIQLGAELPDWNARALGYAGLGNSYREMEGAKNLELAERNHVLSLREARLHHLRVLEGDALHDLAVIAFERRDARGGLIHARDALDAFGEDDARVPRLANDVAWPWLNLLRSFERAFELFDEVSAHFTDPRQRLFLLANLARAAAGMGKRQHFKRAWTEAYELLGTKTVTEGSAPALLQLAYGAMDLAETGLAQAAAEMARDIGVGRNEPGVQARALNLLRRLSATPVLWSTSPSPVVQLSDAQRRASKRFSDELLDVLRRRRGVQPRWTDS